MKNTLVAGFPGDKGSVLAGERARRGMRWRDGERQYDEFSGGWYLVTRETLDVD